MEQDQQEFVEYPRPQEPVRKGFKFADLGGIVFGCGLAAGIVVFCLFVLALIAVKK